MSTAEPLSYDRTPLAKERKSSTNFIKLARQIHLLLGTFFAPAIIFFALTGALQTFSFHEKTNGSDYQPPLWLQKMGQLHKKQTTVMRSKPADRKPASDAGAAQRREEPRPSPPQEGPKPNQTAVLLLKWFVFLMGIGLALTSALGVYMTFKYNRDKRLTWGLLIAGTIFPLAFVLM